jgi:putative membrane protein
MQLQKTKLVLVPAIMALTLGVGSAYAQQAAPRVPAAGNAEHSGAVLTDGQILQIVRTLNDGELKQAQEAMDESESEDVKQLAQMIITDHEASNDMMDDLLKGDLSLDDSPLSETLAGKAEDTHEMLQDLSGSAYDCQYVQKQIAQHEEAINISKTQLMPNAKDAGIKQFLTAMGPKLEHHLMMAQQSAGKATGCQ